jgi:hypothetical protein
MRILMSTIMSTTTKTKSDWGARARARLGGLCMRLRRYAVRGVIGLVWIAVWWALQNNG